MLHKILWFLLLYKESIYQPKKASLKDLGTSHLMTGLALLFHKIVISPKIPQAIIRVNYS